MRPCGKGGAVVKSSLSQPGLALVAGLVLLAGCRGGAGKEAASSLASTASGPASVLSVTAPSTPRPPSKPVAPAASSSSASNHPPGRLLTLDYPNPPLAGRPGDFVLAPPRSFVDNALQAGIDKQTFVFFEARLVQPGRESSVLETTSGARASVPNALVIRIRPGERVQARDVVLTAWALGTGMQRAIVVEGGTPESPRVRYLDLDYDLPDGLGRQSDVLPPGTFHRLTQEGEVGTTLACTEGSQRAAYTVIHSRADKALGLSYAGLLKVLERARCEAVPLVPAAERGTVVEVAVMGRLVKAQVRRVDQDAGRVFVRYDLGRGESEKAVGFGNVLPSPG